MKQVKQMYLKNSTWLDGIVYPRKQKSTRRNILSVIASIIFALLLSLIISSASGTNPLSFFSMFWVGFTDEQYSQSFCVELCTYVVAALAFCFCMKAGMFNIGISGQMLAGGATAFFVILSIKDNVTIGNGGQIITLLLAILGSTFVSLVIGLLKIYCKVNEVVSGIFLNWIILYIVGAIALTSTTSTDGTITYKFLDYQAYKNNVFYTNPIPSSFAFNQSSLGYGWGWSIGVTIICVVVVWVLLKFTVYGHKLKTIGNSLSASKNFGYNVNLIQLSSFIISGILSGVLATIVFTASMTPRLSFQSVGGISLNKVFSEGFDGIAISLIALNNPLGIVLTSFVFAFPSANYGPAGLPTNTVQLITGIIMYMVAIYTVLNYFKPWRKLIASYYGKCNAENYMNLENGIFEIYETYKFSIKKIYKTNEELFIKNHLNSNNNFFLLIVFKFAWCFQKYFHKKVKAEKKEAKNLYIIKRQEVSKSFKLKCIENIESTKNLKKSEMQRLSKRVLALKKDLSFNSYAINANQNNSKGMGE